MDRKPTYEELEKRIQVLEQSESDHKKDGCQEKLVGTIQDVSEHKLLEESLQRSEALLKATQKLSKVGAWEWNVEKQTTYWTEEVYRIHDFQPSEFPPGSIKHIEQSIECYDPEDRPIILEAFQNCSDKRQSYDLEFPFTTAAGRRIWVRTVAIPILKDGSVVKVLGNIMDITESKQAEEALRKSEERHRLFFENSPIGIIHYNSKGVITEVNDAMITIFGSSYEKLIGLSIDDVSDKKFAKEVYKSLKGESGYYEGEYISHSGGKLAIIKANWNPVIRDGEIIAGIGIVQDVTENKRAEKALKESEERYKGLFINSASGVAIYEVKGDAEDFIFKDFNKSAEKIDNQKKETLIGRSIFDARPQVEEFGFVDVLREVWKTGESKHFPTSLYQDGKLNSWYENFVYKLPSGELVAIFTDETDRMRAEQALKIEHDKLQSVLNGMGEGIYIVNKELNIEFQNNLFIKFFGDHKGEKCYKAIYKRNVPCQHCLISQVLKTNSIQQQEINPYNGKYYDLLFSPLKKTQKTDNVIVFIKDITEEKFLRAEAMRAAHLASLGELAAGVAHEINNPITGIITIAEVLSNTFHKMGKNVELPNLIISEGERIGQIVNNLLSFASDREEEHSPVKVNDILNDTLALTQKQILKDGIHFSVDIPSGIPKIKARAHEIQQVFFNVISNARYALNKKFPKPNKDKIFKISVKTIGTDGKMYVQLAFYDRGKGMSEDIIDKIKDPFFSTKPKGEGTGLGLSISHGIIRSHKGKIRFESQEGKDTKVMIDLPVHNG